MLACGGVCVMAYEQHSFSKIEIHKIVKSQKKVKFVMHYFICFMNFFVNFIVIILILFDLIC